MSVTLPLINNYIDIKESSINQKYRPKYHMSPRVGWMNDPNGLIYFNNTYHLYYQANPYRTRPGQMVWGHFVSKDLITFKDLGVALSLDQVGESAYSGGAIEKDGEINIFYTLHTEKHPTAIRYDGEIQEEDQILTEKGNEKRKSIPHVDESKDIKEEEVFRSTSKDGMSYEKGERVFDNTTLPTNISQTDFRDPCPVKIGDYYYIFLGGRDMEIGRGIIVVLKSNTLSDFKYDFTIGPFYELGTMGECPSYFKIDNKDVLVASGCNVHKRGNDFKNINCSVFVVGNIDFENKKMTVDSIKEIDKGDSFYAPQFIRGLDHPVIVGWMEMWGKNYPTSKKHHGWVGAFSIPRELSIKNGIIYQTPTKELEKYSHVVNYTYLPNQSDISCNIDNNSFLLIKGETGEVKIGNKEGRVYVDNTNANTMYDVVRCTNEKYSNPSIRILVDTSSVEVFVDDGKEVITTRMYIGGQLELICEGNITNKIIKEIRGDAL